MGRPSLYCRRSHRQRFHEAARHPHLVTPALVIARWGSACGICTGPVNIDDRGDLAATLDHVTPRSRGGEHSVENVRMAHRICNEKKKDRIGFTLPPIGTATQTNIPLF